MGDSDAADSSAPDVREPIVSPSRLVVMLIPVALAAVVIAAMFWPSVAAVQQQADESTLRAFGLTRGIEHRLASVFSDANGDLVADPPGRCG